MKKVKSFILENKVLCIGLAFLGKLLYGLNRIYKFCIMIYKTNLIPGRHGLIGSDVIFKNHQNIVIGKNTYINGGMIVAGKESKIVIGEDCCISYNVHIRADTHGINLNIPVLYQEITEKDIVIGDDVWIGYGVQILCGVTVGSHSIIGAGSVVTRDIPDNVIVGGVPAKIIKNRNADS